MITVNNPPLFSFDTYGYDTSEWPVEWDAPWREYPCQYFIWSLEKETTLHIQGYIELREPLRYTALKKWPGLEKAHFEPRGGSQQEAIEYCEKWKHPNNPVCAAKMHTHIEGPFIIGTPSEQLQGKARKINAAAFVGLVRSGATDQELWDTAPSLMLLHGRKTSEIRQAFQVVPPRDSEPFVFLFSGAPKTGKTRLAFALAKLLAKGPNDIYFVDTARGSGLYWDEYNGQTCVILDEMDGARCQVNFFKQMTDRYPFRVHPLGRPSVNFNSPYIFVTSNTTPSHWWPKAMQLKNNADAIMRRFFICQHFPKIKKEFPNAFKILMATPTTAVAPTPPMRPEPEIYTATVQKRRPGQSKNINYLF